MEMTLNLLKNYVKIEEKNIRYNLSNTAKRYMNKNLEIIGNRYSNTCLSSLGASILWLYLKTNYIGFLIWN